MFRRPSIVSYRRLPGAPPSAPAGITGALAVTQAGDTLSSAGVVDIAAAASITQAANTSSAAGTVAIVGASALTQAAQTLSATGGADAIAGTAAITQAANTLSSAGTVALAGAGAITQAANTSSAAGTVAIAGAFAKTQAANTLAAAGSVSGTTEDWTISVGAGYTDVSPKQIVRTSGDVLYVFAANCDAYPCDDSSQTLRAYKADSAGVASGFTRKDSADEPDGIAQWAVAIDSSDVVHIVYTRRTADAGNIASARYVTFTTSTDQWGTPENIDTGTFSYSSGQGDQSCSMALDSNGIPHAVYLRSDGTRRRMYYRNRIGGTWSSAELVDDQSFGSNEKIWHPNIVFDVSGRRVCAWLKGTFNDTADGEIYVRVRETNDTWDTTVNVSGNNSALTSIDQSTSMVVTPDNRYHITYIAASTTPGLKYIKYAYSDDTGATWTNNNPTNQATHNPSLGYANNTIRIFGHGTPDSGNHGENLYYFEGTGGGGSWSSWTLFVTGTNYDSSVATRWARYFHNAPDTWDVAYWDDNYPNNLYVGTSIADGISAAASLTQAAQTVSSAGVVAVAGASAVTQAANTSTAAGTVATAGAGAITQAANTSTAAGAVAIVGSASVTQAANTLSATSGGGVLGDAALTQAANTSSAAGTVAIVGASALTQAAQTISSAGVVAIAGAAAITQAANTLAAAGGAGVATGSAAITQAANTVSSAGAVAIVGTATITQGNATCSAAGVVAIFGALSKTQAANTLSATGAGPVTITGKMTATVSSARPSISGSGSRPSISSSNEG